MNSLVDNVVLVSVESCAGNCRCSVGLLPCGWGNLLLMVFGSDRAKRCTAMQRACTSLVQLPERCSCLLVSAAFFSIDLPVPCQLLYTSRESNNTSDIHLIAQALPQIRSIGAEASTFPFSDVILHCVARGAGCPSPTGLDVRNTTALSRARNCWSGSSSFGLPFVGTFHGVDIAGSLPLSNPHLLFHPF